MAFIRGVNGQVHSVLGIGRDVTERLESERHRRLLETALDAAGEAAVGRDITEQRLIEGQLRQAQKAEVMGQVSVEIAHDSRNGQV